MKITSNGCAPKNALFCCHSPVCLNSSPKILPIDGSDYNHAADIVPVRIPDLTQLTQVDIQQSQQQQKHEQQQKTDDTILADAQASSAASVVPKKLAQETRLGVILRRTTPPKKNIVVKKPEHPLMGVVLRKVEKQTLLPPKIRPHERSPPPKKAQIKKKLKVAEPLPQPPPQLPPQPKPKPINLLLNRPPQEVIKIEGDKIIIIRRVPRVQPGSGGAVGGAVTTKTNSSSGTKDDNQLRRKKSKHTKGPPKIIVAQVMIKDFFYLFCT